jgi:hypothetical protein
VTAGDRRLLVALAALSGLAALCAAGGVLPTDVLYFAPVLMLALPLLAGRYVGEDAIARLAGARRSRGRRSLPERLVLPRGASRAFPRGGRLIATSLAVRPPPALAST